MINSNLHQKAAEIVVNKLEKTGSIESKYSYFYNIFIPKKIGKRKRDCYISLLEDDDLLDETDNMIIDN